MARRPTKVAAAAEPVDMGKVRKQLEKPALAANLTVAEVSELKERRRLLERFERESSDAYKVMVLLRAEYQKHAQQLVEKYGLDTSNDHNIDTEAGAIWLVATYVDIEPEVVEEPEATPVAAE